MKIPLVGGQARGRSRDNSFTLRQNCYIENSENQNDKEQSALIGTAGLNLFATVVPTLGSEGRDLYVTSNDRFFSVTGDTLAEISSSGAVTVRGTLNTSSGTVTMTDNGVHLMIVDGVNGYLFTLATNVLLQITTANFPNSGGFPDGATHVVFLDQYAIVNKINTFEFYISISVNPNESANFTDWSALDFGTAESSPDNIIALETLKGDLWVFGEQTVQTFYNSGNADFPFAARKASTLEFGCLAKNSVGKLNNSLFWLGSNKDGNRVVFKSVGYNAQRISDHALEYELGQMAEVSDAIGYTYQQEGHYFYIITFKNGDKTFCWDDTTQAWHERNHRDAVGNIGRHRALYQELFNEKNYVSDFANGNIYELSLDHYSDNGLAIIRKFTLPHFHNEQKFLYYDRFQIDMQTGVGLVTGQGDDPQIMLRWSDDGGYNWSPNTLGSIGKLGNYGLRVSFWRLGRSRSRVFEISMSDPVKFYVMSTNIETRVGA